MSTDYLGEALIKWMDGRCTSDDLVQILMIAQIEAGAQALEQAVTAVRSTYQMNGPNSDFSEGWNSSLRTTTDYIVMIAEVMREDVESRKAEQGLTTD